MRVLPLPHPTRSRNPYIGELYRALETHGVTVVEPSAQELLAGDVDLVHVHWPELFASGDTIGQAFWRRIRALMVLRLLRIRRIPVVWTIHNLEPHERRPMSMAVVDWFSRHVDAYLTLSKGAERAALDRFPWLRERPGAVTPMGHYRGRYPDRSTAAEARERLSLPIDALVFAFVGFIRPYKGVQDLLDAFRGFRSERARLLVVGSPADDRIGASLVNLAEGDDRIHLRLEFVRDEEIQYYVNAADVIVLPFLRVTHSSSALLALSFDRPVAVPAAPALLELEEAMGDEWVHCYTGTMSAQVLEDVASWVERTAGRRGRAPVEQWDWGAIAHATLDLYQRACVNRSERRRRA